MHNDSVPLEKVAMYSRWGEWAVNLALILFAGFLIWFLSSLLSGHPEPSQTLVEGLSLNDLDHPLSKGQGLVASLFLFAPDFVGVAMLLTARALFIGFRTIGVLTLRAAGQLNRIGVLILAIAPVSILAELFGNFLLTLWMMGSRISISLSLEDFHFYAIIIGLIITAASKIMLETLRISAENDNFV